MSINYDAPKGFCTRETACKIFGLSKASLHRYVLLVDGFPRPRKFGNKTLFVLKEIEAYQDKLAK